jgi:release factor glutamine methyltransferase
MTEIRQLLTEASAPGDTEARHEAEILLGHVLQRERAWLFTHPDFAPDESDRRRFRELVNARQRGEPVAYLIGRRGFWTFDLEVTADVLIPRPETELLVEIALERIPLDADIEVADLGTGSGAIALAIASERPRARVMATDASSAALAVAAANAERLGIGNVDFAQGDWCAALASRSFDVIASNPPYIAADDIHLEQGDLRFEPASALASGADGLDAIRCIVSDASRHLSAGGLLLLEHGKDQGAAVRALLSLQGFLDATSVFDLGGHERVSHARWPD